MSRKQWYWVGVVGTGLIMMVLTLAITKYIVAGVIGGFIGAVFVYFFFEEKVADEVRKNVETIHRNREEQAEIDVRSAMEGLIQLNLAIRTSSNLNQEFLELVESIIDQLKEVVPQMVERYPSESLTFEIVRIGAEHLPKTIKQYLDMSEEGRERHKETLEKSLSDILDIVRRSREIVEKNEQAEFQVMAGFLREKYSAGNLG